jgi:DNA-binding transcriptional ArsR family regulator
VSHYLAGAVPLGDDDAPSDDLAVRAAADFAMLADPTRLKLLWLLGSTERDVTTLAGLAGVSPSLTSQHLAKLRLAGLVQLRAEGKRRIYSIRGEHLRTLITEGLSQAEHRLDADSD